MLFRSKLEVWDSPNSAGIVIDAVRCARLGLDHGLKGALIAPSSYFKKSPPYQFPDNICREMTEAFIKNPRGTEQKLAERVRALPGSRDAGAKARGEGTRAAGRAKPGPARPSVNGSGAAARTTAKRRRAVATRRSR